MQWLELSVQVPSEFVEPVSYLFGRYGKGLSIEDVGGGQALLRTYLTSTSKQKRARIEVGVKLIGALKPIGDLCVRELDGGGLAGGLEGAVHPVEGGPPPCD